ncbi:MAG TPA: glycoside hydrolase family 3 protein [Fibrobacter sp.]|nr:glycoside hydrolase family 3 protein [Fibrobacter sp.]
MLKGPQRLLNSAASGVYMIFAKYGSERALLGVINHQGGFYSDAVELVSEGSSTKSVLALTNAQRASFLVVRKVGFLPETLALASLSAGPIGTITLTPDPLESRIDSVMALMTLNDKIGQMIQGLVPTTSSGGFNWGSALQGGGEYSSSFSSSAWAKKIPVSYGKDNVHGMGDVNGSTIFPHNIGLGATRDSALVRRIGESIAKEMWAAGIDLNFSPAISVPRDERWGRVYEGYGETPELAVMMGAAMVRGLQGERFNAEWRVISTAKHFLADGATDKGYDRGESTVSDEDLKKIHLPGYEAVVEQGVLSVMASFNQIRGVHQHVDSTRLTGWLKTDLAFDGYVIADWEGIENSKTPGEAGDYSGTSVGTSSSDAIKKAIIAGIDMAMVPESYNSFGPTLLSLVNSGGVSQARIDDAVRRILRAKFRAGRMDNPSGPSLYRQNSSLIGTQAHKEIAREAVRKSLVLLKNESSVLPLSKTAKIYVAGSMASNVGYQCGGWTKGWQGGSADSSIIGGTNISSGMKEVASSATFTTNAADADVVVYVVGEKPYAEWYGDYRGSNFEGQIFESYTWGVGANFKTIENLGYLSDIQGYHSAGKKVVTVFISGRPLPITPLITASDAFVAAWLPGSEGAGVADVLFGDYYFTGKLPHSWPSNASQIPINVGDGKTPLFEYGFGLTY